MPAGLLARILGLGGCRNLRPRRTRGWDGAVEIEPVEGDRRFGAGRRSMNPALRELGAKAILVGTSDSGVALRRRRVEAASSAGTARERPADGARQPPARRRRFPDRARRRTRRLRQDDTPLPVGSPRRAPVRLGFRRRARQRPVRPAQARRRSARPDRAARRARDGGVRATGVAGLGRDRAEAQRRALVPVAIRDRARRRGRSRIERFHRSDRHPDRKHPTRLDDRVDRAGPPQGADRRPPRRRAAARDRPLRARAEPPGGGDPAPRVRCRAGRDRARGPPPAHRGLGRRRCGWPRWRASKTAGVGPTGDDRYIADYLALGVPLAPRTGCPPLPPAHVRPRAHVRAALQRGVKHQGLCGRARGDRAGEPVPRPARPPPRLVPVPPSLPRPPAA